MGTLGTGCESLTYQDQNKKAGFRAIVNSLRFNLSLSGTFKQVIIFKFPCKMYNEKGYPHIYILYYLILLNYLINKKIAHGAAGDTLL